MDEVQEIGFSTVTDTRADDRGFTHELIIEDDRVAYCQDGVEKVAFFNPSTYKYHTATFRVVDHEGGPYTLEVALFYGEPLEDGGYRMDLGPLPEKFDFIPDETPQVPAEEEGPRIVEPVIVDGEES